jgi:hypothetical protein
VSLFEPLFRSPGATLRRGSARASLCLWLCKREDKRGLPGMLPGSRPRSRHNPRSFAPHHAPHAALARGGGMRYSCKCNLYHGCMEYGVGRASGCAQCARPCGRAQHISWRCGINSRASIIETATVAPCVAVTKRGLVPLWRHLMVTVPHFCCPVFAVKNVTHGALWAASPLSQRSR